jgi:hypothetical protein
MLLFNYHDDLEDGHVLRLTEQAGYSQVEFFIGKREAHVAPIYNLYIGDNGEIGQGGNLSNSSRELYKISHNSFRKNFK